VNAIDEVVLVEQKLLPVGSNRRNLKQTLVSDGFLILRHPDWNVTKQLADIVATQINMYAE
jgi:Holliday junction resolvase